MVESAGLEESPKNEEKGAFLARLRAEAPDGLLAWMDAAVLLTADETRYPPLLGTGGNDGRLDFTNNFMQRIVETLGVSATPLMESAAWFRVAAFGEAAPRLLDRAIGQFAPGAAGGPNATTGFDGDALVNPWDFVLMLEGALPFAAAASRRLGSNDPGVLGYPFTVRTVTAANGGSSTAEEGQARAEMWLPLWDRPADYAEIRHLLAEGRATLGRRPARDGLDFARAVAALGIDRGISSFARYGFMMRSGKAYLATPLGRFAAERNPDADLITDLEHHGFLDRLRRYARTEHCPADLQGLTRRLEDQLFALTRRAEPRGLQSILALLGRIQRAVGLSAKARKAGVPPVPLLSEGWAAKADDGSPEFRIALALASLHADGLPMRVHLAPVDGRKPGWHPEGRLVVWGEGPIERNLIAVLERRLLAAEQQGAKDKPLRHTAAAGLEDVALFLRRGADDARIADLLGGLALVHIPRRPGPRDIAAVIPAAYRVLKPFFATDDSLRYLELLPTEGRLPLSGELVAKLKSGRIDDALGVAWRRLRIAGVLLPKHPTASPCGTGLDGPRLLATLLIPIPSADLARMVRSIVSPADTATLAD